MKKILISLLSLTLIFACAQSAFAQTSADYVGIYDEAELMTATEEQSLFHAISDVRNERGIEIVIVTADYLWNGLSIEGVADAAFETYATGSDGAVFAICMTTRDWWIQGYGSVYNVYSEDVLDWLEYECIDLLSNGEYAKAFKTFVSITDDAIALYDADTPYETPVPWGMLILLSLGAGFTVALIVVLIMKAQLKSVRSQSAAKDYQKQGSLNVTESRDLFLYNTVTRVPKPKNNSSGGGRSGGGGGGGRGGKF